jgi:curved DNA-binding protein
MEFKDYYKTLDVSKAASAEDIKKAYRKGARKYHPDVSKAADAHARMAELNEANEVLSDPEKRAAYDSLSDRAQARDGQDFRPPPHWDAGFEFSDGGGPSGEHSDFFEQLFGRGARSQRAAGRRGSFEDFGSGPDMARPGSDHHARIELDILDAYIGAERLIALRSARIDEQGQVVNEERNLQVKIPSGVSEGQHIRLVGRGSPGQGGAPDGDLLLEVLFKPDARWRAEGRDVFQRVPLSPWEAMLGAAVTVDTPGGRAEVSVPPGWKAGRKLRLKGRGIPASGRSAAGDLYIELELTLPPADSQEGRAAYEALRAAFPDFQPRPNPGAQA